MTLDEFTEKFLLDWTQEHRRGPNNYTDRPGYLREEWKQINEAAKTDPELAGSLKDWVGRILFEDIKDLGPEHFWAQPGNGMTRCRDDEAIEKILSGLKS